MSALDETNAGRLIAKEAHELAVSLRCGPVRDLDRAAVLLETTSMLLARAVVVDHPEEARFYVLLVDLWLHLVVWPSLLALIVGVLVGRFLL